MIEGDPMENIGLFFFTTLLSRLKENHNTTVMVQKFNVTEITSASYFSIIHRQKGGRDEMSYV